MVKQERRRAPTWPLRAVALGVVLLLFLFLLPLMLLPEEEKGEHDPEGKAEPLPTATLPLMEPAAAVPIEGWDASQTLRLLKTDGSVEEITLQDYLWGVTAAEMPASFQLEALKAQMETDIMEGAAFHRGNICSKL